MMKSYPIRIKNGSSYNWLRTGCCDRAPTVQLVAVRLVLSIAAQQCALRKRVQLHQGRGQDLQQLPSSRDWSCSNEENSRDEGESLTG